SDLRTRDSRARGRSRASGCAHRGRDCECKRLRPAPPDWPARVAVRAGKERSMSPARELGRRRLVALVTFIYLLLIFEGAIRKWMFPSLAQALFFVRDPFVLAAYWIAVRHGFFPKSSGFLLTGLGLSLCAVLLVGAQSLAPMGGAGG